MPSPSREELVRRLRALSEPQRLTPVDLALWAAADLIERDGQREIEDSITIGRLNSGAELQLVMSMNNDLRRLLTEAAAGLEPFADFAAAIAKGRPGWDHDEFTFTGLVGIGMKEFRAARALLPRIKSALAGESNG